MPRRPIAPRNIPCLVPGCDRLFPTRSGQTNHLRSHRRNARARQRQRQQTPDSEADTPSPPSTEGVEYGPQEPPLSPDPEGPAIPVPDGGLGEEEVEFHPFLNGLPCDINGEFLPEGTPPPPWEEREPDDFSPFEDRTSFELADLLFRRNQMPGSELNDLMQIWAGREGRDPPFADKDDMHQTIDDIENGDVPWQSFTVSYNGTLEEGDTTHWKTAKYQVYFRSPLAVLKNQLGSRDYADEMDYAAKIVRDKDGNRRFMDFMSGKWVWRNSNILADVPENHGAVLCTIILGSDKTVVSVGTGQTEFYPLYASNGLVHNNIRRAHRNSLTLIGFLAIPKTDKQHADSDAFRKFRRQLFHASLSFILEDLKPAMEKPIVIRYGDGHYRRTIFRCGPYIADYPEQVLVTCVVQGWCPRCDAHHSDLDNNIGGRRSQKLTEALTEAMSARTLWTEYGIVDGIKPFTTDFPGADIHELISPDLLHQIIKGTFKDHLVTWVTDYIELTAESPGAAKEILADIDRRIAAAPPFPGLRRFPMGRGFKQWTGNDSKALMKVYLPAIAGHVPDQMVRALSHFLEFCYLVRKACIDDNDLAAIEHAVAQYHQERTIFDLVRPEGYSLPRQHSMVHYADLIREFGAPNGLCSSITESKHIKAVKEPYRRSSKFEALGQMLITNQRLDKLAAARVDFKARGMLNNPLSSRFEAPPEPPPVDPEEIDAEDVDGEVEGEVLLSRRPVRNIPLDVDGVSAYLGVPHLLPLVRRFLYEQQNPDLDVNLDQIPLEDCPTFSGTIRVHPSATSTFYAPSDISGTQGMRRERIRAVSEWRGGPARRDCVFVERDAQKPGFQGLFVARVHSFLSIRLKKTRKSGIPCALVSWFSTVGTVPCPATGMWIVEPDFDNTGGRAMSIIHLDTIYRGAHLLGRFKDSSFLPHDFTLHDTLDSFQAFYVNKYIDHHAHEIAF